MPDLTDPVAYADDRRPDPSSRWALIALALTFIAGAAVAGAIAGYLAAGVCR